MTLVSHCTVLRVGESLREGRKEGMKEERKKESRRAVARVYVCALHRIWCRCSVARRHDRRKSVTSQPQGRDARRRTHHTVLDTPDALVQRRSRALRLHPSRILWIDGSGCVKPRTRVSCLPEDALSSSPRVSKRPSEHASPGRVSKRPSHGSSVQVELRARTTGKAKSSSPRGTNGPSEHTSSGGGTNGPSTAEDKWSPCIPSA